MYIEKVHSKCNHCIKPKDVCFVFGFFKKRLLQLVCMLDVLCVILYIFLKFLYRY